MNMIANAMKLMIQCKNLHKDEMHYYIFRFKESILGKWLVGVCGGFEGESLEHCGHVFSEFQEYDESTAQDECIAMVEMIMEYWRQEAERIEDDDMYNGIEV